jgi:DNA polymerase III subunit delta'
MDKQLFSGIIGNGSILGALARAFTQKRIAHAYLLSGRVGIGKYKTAWEFSRKLQCTCAQKEGCSRCLACDLAEGQTHPDITTISTQGPTIKIEQIREIQKDIQFSPRMGNYKIYIIDGAEKMTTQASNSILKMLEEPPDYVVFFLLTAQVYSMLPTLISRCQHLAFTTVSDSDVAALLMQHGIKPAEAAVLAAISGGIPGRALSWADNGLILRGQAFICLEELKEAQPGKIWDVVTTLDQEKEQVLLLFEQISIILRDCLFWKTTGNADFFIYKDCMDRIIVLAETATPDNLLMIQKELDQNRRMLLGNANSRLVLEKLCLRIQDVLVKQGGVR